MTFWLFVDKHWGDICMMGLFLFILGPPVVLVFRRDK